MCKKENEAISYRFYDPHWDRGPGHLSSISPSSWPPQRFTASILAVFLSDANQSPFIFLPSPFIILLFTRLRTQNGTISLVKPYVIQASVCLFRFLIVIAVLSFAFVTLSVKNKLLLLVPLMLGYIWTSSLEDLIILLFLFFHVVAEGLPDYNCGINI